MDVNTLLSAALAISTAAGGFGVGRKTASASVVSVAAETVEMLQAQVDLLKQDKSSKDSELVDLRARVELLENLVTQRAEVEAVHADVKASKVILEKIAAKVGA